MKIITKFKTVVHSRLLRLKHSIAIIELFLPRKRSVVVAVDDQIVAIDRNVASKHRGIAQHWHEVVITEKNIAAPVLRWIADISDYSRPNFLVGLVARKVFKR